MKEEPAGEGRRGGSGDAAVIVADIGAGHLGGGHAFMARMCRFPHRAYAPFEALQAEPTQRRRLIVDGVDTRHRRCRKVAPDKVIRGRARLALLDVKVLVLSRQRASLTP